MQTKIHPDSQIGSICLNVGQIDAIADFYKRVIGLEEVTAYDSRVGLGVGGKELLILKKKDGARRYPRHTGLYHFAILVPSRLALAKSLKHLADTQTPVQGFADHWVSEAIYLADPEGNGIEIYRDRPREDWPRIDGRLQMSTEPLDIDGIMAEYQTAPSAWTGLDPATRIGHVHLQVANIKKSDDFYVSTLGLDLIMHFGPSAGFVSAGGYHHHIGYNTWVSQGASAPPPDAGGLAWYAIDLPDQQTLSEMKGIIEEKGAPFLEIDEGILLHDPSGNGVVFRER